MMFTSGCGVAAMANYHLSAINGIGKERDNVAVILGKRKVGLVGKQLHYIIRIRSGGTNRFARLSLIPLW